MPLAWWHLSDISGARKYPVCKMWMLTGHITLSCVSKLFGDCNKVHSQSAMYVRWKCWIVTLQWHWARAPSEQSGYILWPAGPVPSFSEECPEWSLECDCAQQLRKIHSVAGLQKKFFFRFLRMALGSLHVPTGCSVGYHSAESTNGMAIITSCMLEQCQVLDLPKMPVRCSISSLAVIVGTMQYLLCTTHAYSSHCLVIFLFPEKKNPVIHKPFPLKFVLYSGAKFPDLSFCLLRSRVHCLWSGISPMYSTWWHLLQEVHESTCWEHLFLHLRH